METLYPKDISKVHPIGYLTVGTRSVGDEIVRKEKGVGDKVGACNDRRQAEDDKEDRVEANDGFDELKSNGEPRQRKDDKAGEVEKVIAEVILLEGNSANASVDVALWLSGDSKLGAGLL